MDIGRYDNTSLIEFFDISEDAFFMVDEDLIITYSNPAFENYSNMKKEQINGKRLHDVFLKSQGSFDATAFWKALKEKIPKHWEFFSNFRGCWADVSISPLNNGEFAIMIRDITEQKNSKVISIFSDINEIKKVDAILEAIPSAIVLVDAKADIITYINKRALELYGINYIGFDLNSHVDSIKALKLDGSTYALDEMHVWQSLNYGQVVRNKEMEIERSDGKQIPILVSSSPLFNSKGEIDGAIVIFDDITEIKKNQEALQKNEKMLSTIMDNSRDGINMFDLKTGKYVYMNPSQVSMATYSEEEINSLSSEAYLLIHPDDRYIYFKQQKSNASKNDIFYDSEFRWKVQSGEYRWYSDRRTLLRDEEGTPNYMIGISRDITDQKEYEEKLAFQANILSNVSDAIIAMDENERITYCNNDFVSLFGWQEHELEGNNVFNIVHCYDDEKLKEKIAWLSEEKHKAFIAGKVKNYYGIKCYTKDGVQVIIDINMTAVKNFKGEYKGLILSVRDVSERHEYELKMNKSEEKYRYLFNSIDEGLATVEVIFNEQNRPMDIRFIELNPAYEKQTGVVIKNVLGKTAKELKYDFEDFWYETYGNVAITGEPMRFVNEVKTWNKWFDVYVFRIDSENKKIGVLSNDITESVMHNHRLEELIKMQDELYVNVSHELKTPLNVIFSANQLMDIYLNTDSMENNKVKLVNYNNCIKQNCYRLTKLINNIVDLSKSNSNLLTLNLINVNIVEAIENIVKSVSEYVISKKQKIIFNTNVEEKIIACDPDKIERVMLNLISNAIKFSNPNSEIFVNVIDMGSTVEIYVKDIGIGIEKQNLNHIFNKFFQENRSLSRNAEGTGIGLTLIKSLVELHGGNISVESEVNKGSTFRVELPACTIENHEIIDQTKSYNNKVETIKIEFSDIYSI